MRLLTATILLFASITMSAQFKSGHYGELNDSETVKEMKEQISFLSGAFLEGRKAGSEGEKEAAVYFTEVLESYGVDVLSGKEGELFGIRQENGDTLTSRNVIAYIPGYDKDLKNHYIVIGARLDNLGSTDVVVNGEKRKKIYYGANGNASGLAMLAQLAKRLQTNSVLLKRSVIIAAFGSTIDMAVGSWYFLNRSFGDVDKIDAMINLDMLGTGSNGFYAFTASNRDLNALVTKLSGTLQPVQPQLVAQEPVHSNHRMFYDKEIPSVFFTTGMYPEYNTDKDTASIIQYEDMERELEYIYNFSLELVNGESPEFLAVNEGKKRFSTERDVYSYYDCDVKPIFLGSSDPSDFLRNWVYVYLKYPKAALEAGVQGRVLVDFIIDEKGKVTDVKVVKGVSEALDAEAVKVISASPNWRPGRVNGKKVKCELSLYVDFRLEKRK